MERIAEIAVRIELAPGATLKVCDPLEVALDCAICRRCYRTVVFYEGQLQGFCTPTGHAFPGRITGTHLAPSSPRASVAYQLLYHYEPFTDAKYPERRPSGHPTWARVNFQVVCPSCRRVTDATISSNDARPLEWRCACGDVLFIDREAQPVLSAADAV